MNQKSLLSVNNLHVNFQLPHLTIEAVKGVSFDIQQGETLALVGESGSGKSITSMSVLQLLPYPMASHPKGEILYEGQDIMAMSKKELCNMRGKGISMIFQEPMTALNPLQTIYTQIAESIFLHNPKTTKEEAKKRVVELLEVVHMPRPEERMYAYPHELSGGQRQRIVIAMALANRPKLLIADEPTTALDVTVQQQILELLVELQATFKMAILFITHDLTVVQKIADKVCVMKNGEIVEQGTTQQVLKNPQHPYTKILLDSDVKGTKKPYEAEAPVILSAENVNVEFTLKKSFFGKPISTLQAVKNISLSIQQGQTIGIVGESGSGKSTLGKAVLQLLEKNQAHMESLQFEGQDIANLPTKDMRPLRKEMQVVFQDPFGSLSPRMTIRDILQEGLDVHFPTLNKEEKLDRIKQAMLDVDLKLDMINRYSHEFSGGQRQRIAIARAIILRPRFLFLDEPTSALDRNVQVQVVDLLRDLQQKYNLTYLFISHDLSVVKALSDDVIVMKNGEVVEQGTTEQIFSHAKEQYTKDLIKAAFDTTPIK